MDDKRIKVLRRDPEEPFEVIEIPAKIDAFEKLVGGYVECLVLGPDLIAMFNENASKLKLEKNCNFGGKLLRGTILLAGTNEKNEFVDCPAAVINKYSGEGEMIING